MPNENERSDQELQERTIEAEPLIAPDDIAGARRKYDEVAAWQRAQQQTPSICIPITEHQSTEMSLHDVHMLFLNGLGQQFERRFLPETYTLRYRLRRRLIWVPQGWLRGVAGRFRDAYSVLRGYAEIRDPYDEEDHGYWDDE